jgi:hypothetical protein
MATDNSNLMTSEEIERLGSVSTKLREQIDGRIVDREARINLFYLSREDRRSPVVASAIHMAYHAQARNAVSLPLMIDYEGRQLLGVRETETAGSYSYIFGGTLTPEIAQPVYTRFERLARLVAPKVPLRDYSYADIDAQRLIDAEELKEISSRLA